MKARILAAGTLLLAAAATAAAGDPYYNGYGEQAGVFTPSYPSPGCNNCGGGDWNPGCSPYSTCPKGYLWADYCATKDCRPIYKQWCDHLHQALDSGRCNSGCNAGCTSCTSCTSVAASGCANGACQPNVANQLNNPYGGWDGGKLLPVSQGSAPRLMKTPSAPTPACPSPDAPTASSRRSRTTTLKPNAPPTEESSPSDSKFLAPESALPSPVLSAPIAPKE